MHFKMNFAVHFSHAFKDHLMNDDVLGYSFYVNFYVFRCQIEGSFVYVIGCSLLGSKAFILTCS